MSSSKINIELPRASYLFVDVAVRGRYRLAVPTDRLLNLLDQLDRQQSILQDDILFKLYT